MKFSLLKITALFALTIFLTSCEKEEFETNDNDAVESAANAESIMEDIESEALLRTAGTSSTTTTGCPTITYANPAGTYPNTITVDYGTEAK